MPAPVQTSDVAPEWRAAPKHPSPQSVTHIFKVLLPAATLTIVVCFTSLHATGLCVEIVELYTQDSQRQQIKDKRQLQGLLPRTGVPGTVLTCFLIKEEPVQAEPKATAMPPASCLIEGIVQQGHNHIKLPVH